MKEFCEEVIKLVEPKLKYQGKYEVEILDEPLLKDGEPILKNISQIQYYNKEDGKDGIKIIINIDSKMNNPTVISDLYSRGFSDYLKGLGVEKSLYTSIVITILHEFGHLDIALEATSKGRLNSLLHMKGVSYGLIRMLYTPENEPELFLKGECVSYKYNFYELYADNFVYIHFPYVWNQVKHLVEEMK